MYSKADKKHICSGRWRILPETLNDLTSVIINIYGNSYIWDLFTQFKSNLLDLNTLSRRVRIHLSPWFISYLWPFYFYFYTLNNLDQILIAKNKNI